MPTQEPWQTAGDLWGDLKPRAHQKRQRPTVELAQGIRSTLPKRD